MRADPLTQFNNEDHLVAFKYAKDFLGNALGVTLESDETTHVLKNPKSGSTYYAFPLRPLNNGFYTVALSNGMPVSGVGVEVPGTMPTFFAGIDVKTSELRLIQADRFREWVKECTKQPESSRGGMVIRAAEDGAVRVLFSPDWATEVGLIRKTSVMSKGDDVFQSYRMNSLRKEEQFCHLHGHSVFSLLDGAATIEGIPKQAYWNGQPGIALTDHGNMFGALKFYKECRDWGVKPILGCELYMVDDVHKKYANSEGHECNFNYHLTVLAMNDKGWENLCELVSQAGRDWFYYVPRVDKNMLFKHSEGLIVLSGCFKGQVAYHLQQFDPDKTRLYPWMRNDPALSRAVMREYKQHFGDRYYAEVQSNDFERYMYAVPQIIQMAGEEGVPLVVTNDYHYETAQDAFIQAVVTRISNAKVGDGIGDNAKKTGPYWIKPISEIKHPQFTSDMFSRTCEIMDRCSVRIPLPDDKDYEAFFKKFNFPDKKFKYLFPEYNLSEDSEWKDYQAFKAHGDKWEDLREVTVRPGRVIKV